MFPVKTIGAPPATDREIEIRSLGDDAVSAWRAPEETPVAFVYNRRNYAVMLATPQDITDFVVGFSLTEGVIDEPENIDALDIAYTDRGVDLRIKIADPLLERLDMRQRRRNLPGAAGCGVCGLENADAFFTPLPLVAEERLALDEKALLRAIDTLGAYQPINARTRSVHAAAWSTLDGEIALVREDVGRHNALDKLLGAMALEKTDMASGFVLMSSRCSYELVEKSARRGVRALASLSGPTSFALKKAKEANMALYARAPGGVVAIEP